MALASKLNGFIGQFKEVQHHNNNLGFVNESSVRKSKRTSNKPASSKKNYLRVISRPFSNIRLCFFVLFCLFSFLFYFAFLFCLKHDAVRKSIGLHGLLQR